jgi:hypothetical protein
MHQSNALREKFHHLRAEPLEVLHEALRLLPESGAVLIRRPHLVHLLVVLHPELDALLRVGHTRRRADLRAVLVALIACVKGSFLLHLHGEVEETLGEGEGGVDVFERDRVVDKGAVSSFVYQLDVEEGEKGERGRETHKKPISLAAEINSALISSRRLAKSRREI